MWDNNNNEWQNVKTKAKEDKKHSIPQSLPSNEFVIIFARKFSSRVFRQIRLIYLIIIISGSFMFYAKSSVGPRHSFETK